MLNGSTLIEAVIFFIASLPLSSAETRFLQYFYIGVTARINFPEFTAMGLFDGEQFEYYDSNIRKMIPKTEWIHKISGDDPHYWDTEVQKHLRDQEMFRFYLDAAMQEFNQIKGVHTLQRIYGCEIDDDSTTRGFDQYGYDGEDFFSLDLNTGNWTVVNDEAEIIINKWDPRRTEAKYRKNFLEMECIDRIKNFVSYSRESLEMKVPPTVSLFQKHSSSPEVVCFATGFFPKTLIISWKKDGKDVHEDPNKALPNQDGSFQKRSILKVSAEDLQKHTYTCVIQHSSLEKEMVLEVPKGGGLIGVIIGVIVALIVLAAAVAGIVVWRKKNSEFTPVPPIECMKYDSSPKKCE